MKPVAAPWYKLYKPLLFGFGIPFTLIGIITLYINGNLAFIYNGILWLIIGCGIKFKGDYNKRKLKSLKREGLSYECSVMHIIPAHWVRIGSYITARVECACEVESSRRLIKSGYYLLSPLDRIEDLYAKVYFDRNNLEEYVIELARKDNGIIFR